jgi:adenylate cyclase
MGHLYAKLGRRQEALNAVSRLQSISQKRYVSPCEIATVQSALGDRDAASQNLNQCYVDRSWEIIFLKLDPGFAELRGDPRYDALVRKLKI